MNINKAVITAAAPSQRKLPLQTLIDKNGLEKSVLELLIEEVLNAGINDICVVVQPGDEKTYQQILGAHTHQVVFVNQTQPLGYGHALYCANEFVNNEPFLHLVGDHLYVNRSEIHCAKQLVDFAKQNHCAVSAVQSTRESLIPNFGVVGGKRMPSTKDVYLIDKVIEKPTPTQAEQKLLIPGLRAGHYLCFFGMHVLTPTVMTLLGRKLGSGDNKKINLTFALNELAGMEQYLALEINDLRFDMGEKYGLLKAQLALAMNGKDRNRVMSELLEFFVVKEHDLLGR
jgi:UTP--glucose-1-phosphate uridylyltransferase